MTNVRFSHDMMRVISVGGGDHAIFQWRYLPEGSHGDDTDDADGGAYLESNSDESDSEASDVDEVDSDIENVSHNSDVQFVSIYIEIEGKMKHLGSSWNAQHQIHEPCFALQRC